MRGFKGDYAATGQPFADAARLVVDPADTKEFGVVLNVRACAPVRAGDVLAVTFFVRRADAADEGVFWFSMDNWICFVWPQVILLAERVHQRLDRRRGQSMTARQAPRGMNARSRMSSSARCRRRWA